MKKALIILPFIILVIFSITLLERIITKYPLEIFKMVFYSFVYSLPLIIAMFMGEKYLNKNPASKKIFWKMPIYSIIPSIILVFLFAFLPILFGTASGEYGMIIFYIPKLILIFTIVYMLISLFLSTILYFQNKIYSMILSILVIILFLVSLIISVGYVSSCGLEGCQDINHLSKIAMENNNPSICELALPDDKGHSSPILVDSEFIVGSVSECYLKLAQISNNQGLCEEVGLMSRGQCFVYFAENNIPILCEEMIKSNSKSICYFEYAVTLKEMNYCDKIQNITRDEAMADYIIETESFTKKRCQQIIDPKLKEVEDWLNKLLSKPIADIDCDLNNEQEKNHCIYAFAFNNADPRLCKDLSIDKRTICCNDVFAKLFDKGKELEDHTWVADNITLTLEQRSLCGL